MVGSSGAIIPASGFRHRSQASRSRWVRMNSGRWVEPISSSPSNRNLKAGRFPPAREHRLDGLEHGQDLPLHVRGPPGEQVLAADRGPEGVALPQLQRVHRLHVVVAVDQDRGRGPARRGVLPVDQGRPRGWESSPPGRSPARAAPAPSIRRRPAPRCWRADSVETEGMASSSSSSRRKRGRLFFTYSSSAA